MSDAIDEIGYEMAMAELEEILNAVEEGDVGLDDLGGKVARAATLIRACQTRIKSTEMTVHAILEQLGGESAPDGDQ
jgi:exodeoxyribonuclease VII small subunit